MRSPSPTPLPRLSFDELPAGAREAVRPRYERLGYLGEIFSLLGSNETTLLALLGFADGVGRTLDPVQREVVALTVSAAKTAESELFQHERRALSIGMPRALIEAIEMLDPDRDDLGPDVAVIVRLGLSIARERWDEARPALAEAVERLGAETAVALLMQAGYYVMATAIGHVLDLTPPVRSIFAEGEI